MTVVVNASKLFSVVAPVPFLLALAQPALADDVPAPGAPGAASAPAATPPAAAPPAATPPADPNAAAAPAAAAPLAATEPAAAPPEAKTAEEAEEDKRPIKFGAMLGLVSIPRPLEIEVGIRYKKILTVGLQYSWFPQLAKFGDIDVNFSAIQVIPRWHPFKGSFYLGLGVGYQFLTAKTELLGSTIEASADAFVLTPQLGWLWVWDFGLALGLNLGVQLPIGGGDPGVKGVPTTGTNIDSTVKDLDDITKTISKTPLPVIDLLKIGFFF